MPLTVADIRSAYESEDNHKKGLIAAARLIDHEVADAKQAELVIRTQVQFLLDAGKYALAGLLLWGKKRWNFNANSVREIQRFYQQVAKGIILGGGSQGKSFTVIGMIALDWIRDPENTSVKVISTSAGHAKSNAFSTLVDFHQNAIIPLPGNQLDGFIGLDSTGDRRQSIEKVKIPQGEDGKGRLQGFHPVPRKKPHPVFGDMTRIIAFLDEAEEVPDGVWDGIGNMLGSQHGIHTIKVIAATNPRDSASSLALRAEPEGGWEGVDVDSDFEWLSKERWNVLRIDPAMSENVKTGKLMFPGMMTREGYEDYLYANGGNSPQYFSFGRGIYPPQGANDIIISSELVTKCRGEFIFTEAPRFASGTDIAVDGRDDCCDSILRFGYADAFRKLSGEIIRFPRRFVVQLDHIQEIPKGETKIVGDNIRSFNTALHIEPRWWGVDRTGNGASVHDYLRAIVDDEIYGVDFRLPASEKKILTEDKELPCDEYEGVVTEVWFALQRYMQAGCFGIGPGVVMDKLRRELTTRKYVAGTGRRIKVQDKDDWKKKNGGKSPDRADSLTISLHTIRMQGGDTPSMTEVHRQQSVYAPEPKHGHVDQINFISI